MRRMLFLAVLLAGCGGYDGPEVIGQQTAQGVMVTDNVPTAYETVQDIIDRGQLPPQGDRVMP